MKTVLSIGMILLGAFTFIAQCENTEQNQPTSSSAANALDKTKADNKNQASPQQVAQELNLNPKQQAKQDVESRFRRLLEDIDTTLLAQHQQLKTESGLLLEFVDEKIIPYWDIELTLRLLVGSKTWKSLAPSDVQKLRQAFVNTMHRYVYEGVNLYDGQRAKFIGAKLSSKPGKNNQGQITIQLEPVYLPSFNIHFKVAKRDKDWLLYDIFVEGVSYIKLKKNEYRQIINTKGVEGLLAHLGSKNIDVTN